MTHHANDCTLSLNACFIFFSKLSVHDVNVADLPFSRALWYVAVLDCYVFADHARATLSIYMEFQVLSLTVVIVLRNTLTILREPSRET